MQTQKRTFWINKSGTVLKKVASALMLTALNLNPIYQDSVGTPLQRLQELVIVKDF